MKGVLDVEFILSVFLFLGSISFIIIFMGRESVALQNFAGSDNLQSESYQISEMLMFDEGSPSNWWDSGIVTPDAIKRIGLSSGNSYFLNKSKLIRLHSLCDEDDEDAYNTVRDLTTGLSVNITITDKDGNVLYKCEPPIVSLSRPKFETNRIGIIYDSPNEIVKIKTILIG